MVISVQMDTETASNLAFEAERTKRSRNSIIKIAIREYLHRQQRKQWPESVLQHFASKEVLHDIPAFESYRSELPPPREIDF